MPLLALTTDKQIIDLETAEWVVSILDYELRVRTLTDPIDADNTIAKMEEKIRRVLKSKGRALNKRELGRAVHANRYRIWAFEKALSNVVRVGEVSAGKDRIGPYRFVG